MWVVVPKHQPCDELATYPECTSASMSALQKNWVDPLIFFTCIETTLQIVMRNIPTVYYLTTHDKPI